MAKLSNKEITDDNISSKAIHTLLIEYCYCIYANEAKGFVHRATCVTSLHRNLRVLGLGSVCGCRSFLPLERDWAEANEQGCNQPK